MVQAFLVITLWNGINWYRNIANPWIHLIVRQIDYWNLVDDNKLKDRNEWHNTFATVKLYRDIRGVIRAYGSFSLDGYVAWGHGQNDQTLP